MYKEKRNILLSIFLFFQIALVALLSGYPDTVDRYYVNRIYPLISGTLRTIFGWIPFSAGDLLYALLIFFVIRFFWKMIFNKKKNRRSLALNFVAGFSVFYFCFYFFWGLNYSRSPLQKTMGLKKEPFDIVELRAVTDKILLGTIRIQQQLTSHDSMPVVVPHSKKKILSLTVQGYENLSKQFPFLSYESPSLKKSLFSLPLTYMGFSGYFNPLTGEGQVDSLVPKINLPFTCSHEVAHQLGIASESEANFIGFLAASHNEDPYFQYAAKSLALRYALIDIRRYDKDLFASYVEKIPKGILKNFKESDEFWQAYENPLEPFFKSFYDKYLKYNQQEDGLESYNQIIDLIISYDKSYGMNYY